MKRILMIILIFMLVMSLSVFAETEEPSVWAKEFVNNVLEQNILREDFFDLKIKPIMLPKAFELLKDHRNRGDFLLIITATNRFVTEIIAKAFEVDDLIATEPEMINNKYTGKGAGIPSFKEGKITRLNEWLSDKQHALSGAFFYSDSQNDLPLLRLVSNPVAANPDDVLKKEASEKDWPIIFLK